MFLQQRQPQREEHAHDDDAHEAHRGEGRGLILPCEDVSMPDPITRLNAALERASYRVERELGEDGMATVYLAHGSRRR